MKEFYCFSNYLYNYLYKCGFRHVEVKPDAKKPWRDCYVFEATEELLAAVAAYSHKN